MRSTRIRLIGAAIATATAAPLMADVVIVRATGPSAPRYVAGKTLPDNARLVLQKGDQIVLLDAHGTRTLAGPGTFAATAASTGGGSSLVALASNTADRRNRVGAVRNLPTDGPPVRPNIFLVDVAAPGNICIADADAATATLWRGQADSAGTSTIVGPDGATQTVAWIKGQSTQPWPTRLPITAGRAYRVTQTGAAGAPGAVTITFQLLGAAPADLPELTKALIAHDCKAQVDVIVATTAAATTG